MKYNSLQELFADRSRWTTGSYARDKNKIVCPIDSEHACCWCLVGGIRLIYGYEDDIDWYGNHIGYTDKAKEVINKIVKRIDRSISLYNDCSTYGEVVQLVKELNV